MPLSIPCDRGVANRGGRPRSCTLFKAVPINIDPAGDQRQIRLFFLPRPNN